MTGWREGLGPWEPVIDDGRLYGRGGADDGYAAFAALTAIEAVRAAGRQPRPLRRAHRVQRGVGQPDLPAHLDQLGDRIGTPSLVVCLDSGCANYDRLWVTTSLRGNLVGRLRVDVLTEGVHSGIGRRRGAVVVPRAAPPARPHRGRRHRPHAPARAARRDPRRAPSGAGRRGRRPRRGGADLPLRRARPGRPWTTPSTGMLARTWEPSLALTGHGRHPARRAGGQRAAPVHQRRPVDPAAAAASTPTRPARRSARALEADPPARRRRCASPCTTAAPGWDAPPTAPWLAAALDAASAGRVRPARRQHGRGRHDPVHGDARRAASRTRSSWSPACSGPASNAHGPNEFLDLETGRRVTAAVAHVLDAHAHR